MLKHYVEFFYPGSFVSETSWKEVESRAAPVEMPMGAYGYRFFSRQEATVDGETLTGKPKDYSPMTYFGEALTLEDVERLPERRPGEYDILKSNMRCNGWKRMVRTIRGNFQPLNDDDVVIAPASTGA